MSDETIPARRKAVRGLSCIYASLPIEARIIIGLMLAYFIVLGGVALFGNAPDLNKCWELQIKEGRFFKINTCDGAVIELDNKTMEPMKPGA